MLNYAKLQTLATKVINSVKQGTIILVRETEVLTDPDEPWGGVTRTEVEHVLKATAGSVNQKYVDGDTILATDKQIVFAVPDVEPNMTTDWFKIDGVEYRFAALKRIPEAGTPVAYIAIVRI